MKIDQTTLAMSAFLATMAIFITFLIVLQGYAFEPEGEPDTSIRPIDLVRLPTPAEPLDHTAEEYEFPDPCGLDSVLCEGEDGWEEAMAQEGQQ